MALKMETEPEISGPPLKGSKQNPARDPAKANRDGRGSIGDQAFMMSVCIVAAAWIILLALAYSLRHHNV